MLVGGVRGEEQSVDEEEGLASKRRRLSLAAASSSSQISSSSQDAVSSLPLPSSSSHNLVGEGGSNLLLSYPSVPVPNAAGSPSSSSSLTFSAALQPPAPRQAPQRLQEVPDRLPPNFDTLRRALAMVRHIVTNVLHCSVIELPHADLSQAQVEECLGCCEEAVREATLSSSYPMYCLKEVRSALHPYVQGALLEAPHPPSLLTSSSSSTTVTTPRVGRPPLSSSSSPAALSNNNTGVPRRRICSLIFTNGMDLYGNLKITITQLKSSIHRGMVSEEELQQRCNRMDDAYGMPHSPSFVKDCLAIRDVSPFVHVTLSATHPEYQGLRLATILFTLELLKWSIRGRRYAFLNMAIEKKLVETVRPPGSPGKGFHGTASPTTRVEYVAPEASRRLYRRFGFRDVYPRLDPLTGKERWTSKEADMGRVMVNFDIAYAALRASERLEKQYLTAPLLIEPTTTTTSVVPQRRAGVDENDAPATSNPQSSVRLVNTAARVIKNLFISSPPTTMTTNETGVPSSNSNTSVTYI